MAPGRCSVRQWAQLWAREPGQGPEKCPAPSGPPHAGHASQGSAGLCQPAVGRRGPQDRPQMPAPVGTLGPGSRSCCRLGLVSVLPVASRTWQLPPS